MTERRRHRLIWCAVGGAHLAVFGAIWAGGAAGVIPSPREGGLVMVTLVSEPVALPGEAAAGVALGAGLPVPVAPRPVPPAAPVAAIPPAASPALVAAPAPEPVARVAPVAAAPAPLAEAFVPPAFRARQEPAYPERARRAGAEGVASVRLRLAADGTVLQAELTRSTGSRLLDEAALAAARGSGFAPATRGGVPVASEATADYRFELR